MMEQQSLAVHHTKRGTALQNGGLCFYSGHADLRGFCPPACVPCEARVFTNEHDACRSSLIVHNTVKGFHTQLGTDLRVSSDNNHHGRQGHVTDHQTSRSRKPLGSKYVSDQFSNFFNAYATRSGSTKPMGGQGVYSSIRLVEWQLLPTDSFGM
jgi:hypothetical protein